MGGCGGGSWGIGSGGSVGAGRGEIEVKEQAIVGFLRTSG